MWPLVMACGRATERWQLWACVQREVWRGWLLLLLPPPSLLLLLLPCL